MNDVLVLMSTYNGEQYLEEQLDSLMNQKDVELSVLVRDDGSTDKTLEILKIYKNRMNLEYYTGDNLKPARSFMDLLKNATEYEYYAFCDQDDVWKEDKLKNAVNILKNKDVPLLYYCGMEIVDEKLEHIGYYHRNIKKATSFLYSSVLGDDISGCTMVINKKLRDYLILSNHQNDIMHDVWVHRVCLACGGEIYSSESPDILYRQHSNNAIGMRRNTFIQKLNSVKRNKNKMRNVSFSIMNDFNFILKDIDRRIVELIIQKDKIKKFELIKLAYSDKSFEYIDLVKLFFKIMIGNV